MIRAHRSFPATMSSMMRIALPLFTLMSVAGAIACDEIQAQPTDSVRAIARARTPLPTEAASASITRFSYIVYGDTRGRRDGTSEQYEHSLVVDQISPTSCQRMTMSCSRAPATTSSVCCSAFWSHTRRSRKSG